MLGTPALIIIVRELQLQDHNFSELTHSNHPQISSCKVCFYDPTRQQLFEPTNFSQIGDTYSLSRRDAFPAFRLRYSLWSLYSFGLSCSISLLWPTLVFIYLFRNPRLKDGSNN